MSCCFRLESIYSSNLYRAVMERVTKAQLETLCNGFIFWNGDANVCTVHYIRAYLKAEHVVLGQSQSNFAFIASHGEIYIYVTYEQ